MVSGHGKKRPTCIHCKGRHTTSQHDHHGKDSFIRFKRGGETKKKVKGGKKLSHDSFIRRMNKGRKKVGLKPIPLRKKKR